jgi:hypothetical protein
VSEVGWIGFWNRVLDRDSKYNTKHRKKMEPQQMLELLLARMDTNIKALQEVFLAKIDANWKAW